RRRLGVAAGEQRDVVSLVDELFGKVRNDAFGAPVEFGRHPFEKRGDLSNPHQQDLRLSERSTILITAGSSPRGEAPSLTACRFHLSKSSEFWGGIAHPPVQPVAILPGDDRMHLRLEQTARCKRRRGSTSRFCHRCLPLPTR